MTGLKNRGREGERGGIGGDKTRALSTIDFDASTKGEAGQCVKASLNARTSEVRSRFHRSQGFRFYGGSCVRALWLRA